MAKESLANKMARKAFYRNDVQQSWKVHIQAFGPILKPAFPENYQAKIHITAALNHISKGNLQQALPKLQNLQSCCETEADKAALLFIFGVYCETAGNQEQAVAYYDAANQCGHGFYLPYLKVARFCLSGRMCGQAEENFRKAIGCFEAAALSDAERIVLGSAYTNLASCLTMQHRYEEAQTAIDSSRSICPDAPGRAAAEAVLYALRGDGARVAECLEILGTQGAEMADMVKKNTDAILAGTDPMFFAVPVETEKIAGFWQWFAGYEGELMKRLDGEQYDQGLTPVAQQLLEAFPFLEEIPNVALGRNEKGYVIELKDYYAVGIKDAYEKLLAACPAAVGERWQFAIAH